MARAVGFPSEGRRSDEVTPEERVAASWGTCAFRVSLADTPDLRHVASEAAPDRCSWCGEARL